MKNFEEKLSQYVGLVEKNLRQYNVCTEENRSQRTLIDAMNYSLEAGGKRIRPALVYKKSPCTRLCNRDDTYVLSYSRRLALYGQ